MRDRQQTIHQLFSHIMNTSNCGAPRRRSRKKQFNFLVKYRDYLIKKYYQYTSTPTISSFPFTAMYTITTGKTATTDINYEHYILKKRKKKY